MVLRFQNYTLTAKDSKQRILGSRVWVSRVLEVHRVRGTDSGSGTAHACPQEEMIRTTNFVPRCLGKKMFQFCSMDVLPGPSFGILSCCAPAVHEITMCPPARSSQDQETSTNTLAPLYNAKAHKHVLRPLTDSGTKTLYRNLRCPSEHVCKPLLSSGTNTKQTSETESEWSPVSDASRQASRS